MRRSLILIAIALTLSACAEPDIRPYDPATYTDGIRFTRPAQYLLVSSGGASTIIQLPDHTQEYVLRAKGWIGNVDLKPVLTDGWNLTAIDASVDKTAPVAALLNGAVVGAHALVGGALRARPAVPAALAPGLYRIYTDPPRLVGPMKLVNP